MKIQASLEAHNKLIEIYNLVDFHPELCTDDNIRKIIGETDISEISQAHNEFMDAISKIGRIEFMNSGFIEEGDDEV